MEERTSTAHVNCHLRHSARMENTKCELDKFPPMVYTRKEKLCDHNTLMYKNIGVCRYQVLHLLNTSLVYNVARFGYTEPPNVLDIRQLGVGVLSRPTQRSALMREIWTWSVRYEWLLCTGGGSSWLSSYIQIGGLGSPAPSFCVSERFEVLHVQSGVPFSPFLHWAISSFFGFVVIPLFFPRSIVMVYYFAPYSDQKYHICIFESGEKVVIPATIWWKLYLLLYRYTFNT